MEKTSRWREHFVNGIKYLKPTGLISEGEVALGYMGPFHLNFLSSLDKSILRWRSERKLEKIISEIDNLTDNEILQDTWCHFTGAIKAPEYVNLLKRNKSKFFPENVFYPMIRICFATIKESKDDFIPRYDVHLPHIASGMAVPLIKLFQYATDKEEGRTSEFSSEDFKFDGGYGKLEFEKPNPENLDFLYGQGQFLKTVWDIFNEIPYDLSLFDVDCFMFHKMKIAPQHVKFKQLDNLRLFKDEGLKWSKLLNSNINVKQNFALRIGKLSDSDYKQHNLIL